MEGLARALERYTLSRKDPMSTLLLLRRGEQARSFELKKERTLIGRGSTNDLRLGGKAVSRHHALIVTAAGNTYLEDLNSTNGTHVISRRREQCSKWDNGAAQAYEELNVNTKRVKRYRLRPGEIIRIGKHYLRFLEEQRPHEDTVEMPRPSMQVGGERAEVDDSQLEVVEIT